MTESTVLPEAFQKKMRDLLGAEYESFQNGYENRSFQALRFNPLKKGWDPSLEQQYLSKVCNAADQAERVPWAEHAWYYEESGQVRPGKHLYHELGLYYIQEPSAMSAAALLHPRPGERVLDLCAAPGGKSTQLASYMEQSGLLVSNEIHPARSRILSQNIERLGIANAIVSNEDGASLAERFPSFFHRILVDAPCSGEGMFRKNPMAADEWSVDHVRMCATRQLEILEYAASMLMSGGRMVYSTCTFSPEENEQVIDRFLERHREFDVLEVNAPWFDRGRPEWGNGNPKLQQTFRLWPHRLHGEGHYAAVLVKSEAESADAGRSRRDRVKKGGLPDKKQKLLLEQFLKETLLAETAEYLLSGHLFLFGDTLFRLPDDTVNLQGLHIQRAGLEIGSFRKNRFEPSHALALFLGKDEVNKSVSLFCGSPEAEAYYRGESLQTEAAKGWNLICTDGFSSGWGKSDGRVVKNHYPKGLRRN